MHSIIRVEEAVTLDNPVFIDVRSPVEYEVGHIPNAINIPLFENSERVEVGTTYKQVGPEEAKELGLAYVSAKLPSIVGQIRQFYKSGQQVIVYCWRGGMRSKSIVSILEMMGISASQLLGGYKAYRQYLLTKLNDFEVKPRVVVLCGSTGTGKTAILERLADRDIPVIDLENLANHRGSVFGQIGLGKPATAQNFDAALLTALEKLNNKPYIVVECESKRIGNVYLPDCLFAAMKQGKKILISTDIEVRVERLIEEYLDIYNDNCQAIAASIESLRRRLGNKKTDQLLTDFNTGKIQEIVRTLLIDYYDPMYGYEKSDIDNYDLWVKADDMEQATEKIVQYLQQLGR